MGQKHEVHLENTGEVFGCAEDQNVLCAMERLGRKGIPVGCRGGGCGVCKIHVLEGRYTTRRMSRACVSEAEEAAGILLACKVFPLSNLNIHVVGHMKKCVMRAAPSPSSGCGTGAQPPGAVTA